LELELLKKLSEIDGVSGREKEVRHLMEQELLKSVGKDDITYDNLGTIIAKKGDKGPKIMLAGHMDEIGMIISKITDDGFLKFQTIGGWWEQVMLAQQMTITTTDGKKYHGVIGSKPPHILSPEERKAVYKIDDMYIDLGVKSREEVEKLGIRVGDMITPSIDFRVMANEDYLLGKAWDNRIGCAVVLEVMKEFKNQEHPNTIYGVGTVQEEVGCRGAKTSSQLINPDISIALDVGIAKDTPGTDGSVKMGGGPLILIYDSGLIGHGPLRDLFINTAKENNIPIQIDALKRGGTDAGPMHLAHSGSPAISLCMASRYIHSHTSMISKSDFENTVKLVVAVIKKLDKKTVNQITYY
jgi:endoglucanase